ncbi:shugoshin [Drosophila rhopaloa]|uniref:Shugoshin n=1 Tax=Drosophila rhopaloa TaxID=1041015 RepID=A0A6P4G382_DRORH|nr:shugoshin [Drosophila rhopaloa]
MVTKVEQQYKLLNAELMEQVQKQRLELGEYRKRLVALERENMELREEQVLQNDRQRFENISIVMDLMQRLNVDKDSVTTRQEPPNVHTRPSGPRRSSKDICRDMRKTISLARTTTTISPTRTSSIASTISSSSRRSTAEVYSKVEPSKAPEAKKHTPPPRRPMELMFDEDESDEDVSEVQSPVHKECDKKKEAETDGNQENDRLCSIIEENFSDEASESSSSCEAIYCDTTIEGSPPKGRTTTTPSDRALREVHTNVPDAVTLSRGKESIKSRTCTSRDEGDSVQEPSIQQARLAVPRPSHLSGIFPDISGSTPRRSLFNGICEVAGSTSTPKSFLIEELPSIRIRNRTTAQTISDDTNTSTTYFSTSGRPSRRCRPISLAEPNLKIKMRNEKGKAKK